MMKALKTIGQVDVLYLNPGKVSSMALSTVDQTLCLTATISNADGIFRRLKPKKRFSKDLEILLGNSFDGYSLIVGRYIWGISQLEIPRGMKTIVDLDDFKFRFSGQYGWSLGKMFERVKKSVGHKLLCGALSRFTGAFVVSPRDFDEAARMSNLHVCLLPNVAIHSEIKAANQKLDHQVLFVGSLWYGPNAQAIDWFLRGVWPIVRNRINNASLVLVGAVPEAAKARWIAHEGVQVAGFVEDLALTYAESSVVIVPIQAGGGSNIKVLEAILHKKPCVVSEFVSTAFEPYLKHNLHYRTAETPDQFASQVCEVLLQGGEGLEAVRVENAFDAVRNEFLPELFISKVRQFSVAVMPFSIDDRST